MSEEAVNTDVSLMQESSWNRRSLSPDPTSELKDEFHSKSICGDTVEEKHYMTKNLQQTSTEAGNSKQDSTSTFVLLTQYNTQNEGSLHPNPTSGLKEKAGKNPSCEPLEPLPKDAGLNGSCNQMESLAESVTGNSSATAPTVSERSHEFGFKGMANEPLKFNKAINSEIVGTAAAAEDSGKSQSDLKGLELAGLPLEDAPRDSSHEQIGLSSLDLSIEAGIGQLGTLRDDIYKNFDLDQSGQSQEKASENLTQMGCSSKDTLQKRKKNTRFLVGSTRTLRSMTQEKSKPPKMNSNVEQNNNQLEDGSDQNKRRKRKRKRMKNFPVNEFSRIRSHLRYLIHRIKYEENLIDAYSGEGWKGQSLEKIKPEKELQRAKSEIFRCKLKIRELFQCLDLSCAKGKLPASVFDSEGQIDSEDIFCAKCGSSDLTVDNDIILCDGVCERGFHQFCLEPPLLKKDIPPDDEGWLCPGCDCKVDCIDLLNDSQGTKLSILDSWEKVFPEAAAGAAGRNLDDGVGLPSDDSEDNDYNPGFADVDEKLESSDSSSDESEVSSEYNDLGPSLQEKQYLGLPSDDSKDDDYNPNAPDHDEQVKQESSSSGFTSDSEDLSFALDDRSSPTSSLPNNMMHFAGSTGEKVGRKKKQSLSDELSYLLQSVPSHLSEKRHVEQLDYKKLHDETYGNDSSDSSDEDYLGCVVPKKRKKLPEKSVFSSPNDKTSFVKNETDDTGMKGIWNKTKCASRRTHNKLDANGTTGSTASDLEPDYSDKRNGSKYRRLGEDKTQKLLKSFQENQYPDRTVKADLAKESGLTIKQVSKWFENARWSFRHSSSMESIVASTTPQKGTLSPLMGKRQPESAKQKAAKDFACYGNESKENPKESPTVNLVTGECGGGTSGSQKKTRKRGYNSDSKSLAHISSIEVSCQSVIVDAQRTQQVRRSGRLQTRSEKSIA